MVKKTSTKVSDVNVVNDVSNVPPQKVVEEVVPPQKSEEKAKSSKQKKTTKDVVNDVVTAPSPVEEVAQVENVVIQSETPAQDTSVSARLNDITLKLQQLTTLTATIKSDFKTLDRSLIKELKTAHKASSKKKVSGNRQPSGFVKPTKISVELSEFLGKPLGTEMARTEVSKEINAYIRSNSLQDKDNGRKIIPNDPLRKLLNIQSDDELTYFNLQRYMKHHFIKAQPIVSA
jgi:chromatin remodeling complex protein RSC6